MKKSLLVKLAILLLTITTLSGCVLVPVPVNGGRGGGDSHEGGRGNNHGGNYNDHHEGRGGRH